MKLLLILLSLITLPIMGVTVRDVNGEAFLISGCGAIVQRNYNPWGSHHGINSVDFYAELGDTVFAAFSGTVSRVDYDSCHGDFVVVDGDNGLSARYYHLTSSDKPRVGKRIELGDVIGRVGLTGNTVGNHYGLELGYNDPENLINNCFSSTKAHRSYYDQIINALTEGKYTVYKPQRFSLQRRVGLNEATAVAK